MQNHQYGWTHCTLGCASMCRLVLKCGVCLIYTYDWSSCHSFITYGRGGWSVCLFSWDVLDRNRQLSNKPFILSFCFIPNTCKHCLTKYQNLNNTHPHVTQGTCKSLSGNCKCLNYSTTDTLKLKRRPMPSLTMCPIFGPDMQTMCP